jgi:serine/threonine-protein kinase HipA
MQFGSHPYGKATTHGTATPHSNPDLKADYLPVKLLDAAIFNLIVGNADAHGKNFSILYDRDGPRLAPLYDLLATVAYPELSPKLAMRIGKRATLGEMNARVWSAFATDAGVGLPLIRRRVAEISEAVIS